MSNKPAADNSPFRFCVAPMMDWTDRHCRYFHRLLSKHARLYTEMVTTGALLHGDQPRHLDFNAEEHPVALQLGGSEPADLAACAKLGAQWGYDEINLNCGCPSERVQRGSFGACLMAEPKLVADCVKAMVDAVSIPVTVKHRIGIDNNDSYEFMRDFVGTVSEAGCGVFMVHARSAILKGLSPKQNREVPPLKYELAYRLKQEFPRLTIVLNGGIKSSDEVRQHLAHVDGVMIGREAYHNPYWLASVDRDFFVSDRPVISRDAVEAALAIYGAKQSLNGVPRHSIMRHTLGLYRGLPGARAWRRSMSQQPAWATL
ncbi:MAG: tRNA dihydrouridine(20/20a) synthase DusA [Betaproteobacteria bacterium]|nr:tRNA dihydrouridine(20/20a) synthase DusA [Betaproteobacteria bacterium]